MTARHTEAVPLGTRLNRRLRHEFGLWSERLVMSSGRSRRPTRAVVVAGSGRSGTTWIAEAIAATGRLQQIFEPLQPNFVREARRLAGWEERHWTLVRSEYLSPTRPHPEWEEFWARVLSGKVRNYWTDPVRTAWFPSQFLVKTIRANLMLRFLHEKFHPKIIYVVRHPCAVIASRLRLSWTADVSDLLKQERLMEERLSQWVTDIESERDLVGAHAVWWAVENHIALADLRHCDQLVVHYETACTDPTREIGRVCDWLGLTSDATDRALFAPSRMTLGGSTSTRSRLAGWRAGLDDESCRRILGWAERLGIDWYGLAPLPRV